ncbi:hypothetical protein F5B20DRAFT_588231 [Whalleya microplaca]|nr:hypothetical protein F5B20DRAFT_588231 [Whalleya microplaca]
MSEAQKQAKAEAAKHCDWHGDSPEPELDDLAHVHAKARPPPENCDWRGDSPEPEIDDLSHSHEYVKPRQPPETSDWLGDSPEPELDDLAHSESKREKPKDKVQAQQADEPGEPSKPSPSRKKEESPGIFSAMQLPPEVQFEVPDAVSKFLGFETQKSEAKDTKDPKSKNAPEEASNENPFVGLAEELAEELLSEIVPNADNQPADGDASKSPGQPSEDPEQTLQDKVIRGFGRALSTVQGILHPSHEPSESGEPVEPQPEEHRTPRPEQIEEPAQVSEAHVQPAASTTSRRASKQDKKMAKELKDKARKEKERAKKEKKKEEKEKKAKEKEARQKAKKERKEKKRKEKEKKKSKGKKAPSPPNLPTGTDGCASVEAAALHPHPGCETCQHPGERSALNSIRDILGNWQGLPSFNELSDAARRMLGQANREDRSHVQPALESDNEDSDQIRHMADHFSRHLQQHLELDSDAGYNPTISRPLPHKIVPRRPSRNEGSTTSGNYGLDGHGDLPTSAEPGQTLHNLEHFSLDTTTIQAPFRKTSPPPNINRMSPWYDYLGLNMEDPLPSRLTRRSSQSSKRGSSFSYSPMRVSTTSCSKRVHYHEPTLYACVPVSLTPMGSAVCLETPRYSQRFRHSTSAASPLSKHTLYSTVSIGACNDAQALPASPHRRSVSMTEARLLCETY